MEEKRKEDEEGEDDMGTGVTGGEELGLSLNEERAEEVFTGDELNMERTEEDVGEEEMGE